MFQTISVIISVRSGTLFFTHIRLVVHVLAHVHAIAHIKWIRLCKHEFLLLLTYCLNYDKFDEALASLDWFKKCNRKN